MKKLLSILTALLFLNSSVAFCAYSPKNDNGQETMANSEPVVIASDQSAIPASQSGTWTVQPGNTANTTAWKVDGSAVTQPVSGTFWQATQPVSGTFWQATQPVSGTITADAGTNLNTSALLTTAAHDAAFGTAGTADTQVMSVQGIASMTPVQVSQATASNLNATVTDGAGALNTIVDSGTITAVTSVTNPVAVTQSGTWDEVGINDSGNTITVDGTVTVTDGAGALNVIVDSGAITETNSGAIKTSTELIDDAVATTASAITTKGIAVSGTDGTNARILKTDTGGELQIDVLTMPTTTVSATNLDVQIGGSDSLTIGTFPDNEPFNVAQINGTTTPVATAATDTTGAGVQQVGPLYQADDVSTTACTENRFCHPRINATRRSTIIEGVASGTAVPVSAASGTFASGSYASGAFASGAAASGSWASGALVDITNVSMPITPATATATKTIGLGAEYRSTVPTWTNTQQGALQVGTRGSLHTELWNTDSATPVPSGSGTATGALRVELANNGTGLVTTNPATAANWGIYVEDAAETAGGNLMMAGTVRRDTTGTSAGSTAENATLNSSAEGAVWGTLTPTTTSGLSVANFTSGDTFTALTNTAQVIKASAGNLYGYYIYNPNSSAVYVNFYNIAAASVTVGTSTPLMNLSIPATSGANLMFAYPISFSNAGWSASCTTTGGGNTAPATACEVMVFYK